MRHCSPMSVKATKFEKKWTFLKFPVGSSVFVDYLKNYDSNQKSCSLSVIVLGWGHLLVFLSLFYDECESYKG